MTPPVDHWAPGPLPLTAYRIVATDWGGSAAERRLLPELCGDPPEVRAQRAGRLHPDPGVFRMAQECSGWTGGRGRAPGPESLDDLVSGGGLAGRSSPRRTWRLGSG